jgi:hypothetical protein
MRKFVAAPLSVAKEGIEAEGLGRDLSGKTGDGGRGGFAACGVRRRALPSHGRCFRGAESRPVNEFHLHIVQVVARELHRAGWDGRLFLNDGQVQHDESGLRREGHFQ